MSLFSFRFGYILPMSLHLFLFVDSEALFVFFVSKVKLSYRCVVQWIVLWELTLLLYVPYLAPIDCNFANEFTGANKFCIWLDSTQTTTQWIHTLQWIVRWTWMRHTQGTIHATAVFNCLPALLWVTPITVVSTATSIQSLTAAEIALPGYVLVPMDLACVLTTAYLFDSALSAQ